jgi:hypothetical protein
MLRPPDRLPIGVAEMPLLARLDQAAHDGPVDDLRAPAARTPGATHPPLSHQRSQPPPGPLVLRPTILRLVTHTPQPLTAPLAEPLIVLHGNELAPTTIATADPERAGHSPPQPLRAACAAGPTHRLVPVNRVEIERTAATGFQHGESLVSAQWGGKNLKINAGSPDSDDLADRGPADQAARQRSL